MKTITFISKNKLIFPSSVSLVLAFLSSISCLAQVQNNGNLHIADQGQMYVQTSSYNFGASPATTSTTRTSSTYGKLIFESGVTHASASDSHFTDGYVRTLSTSQFIFPIGQSGVYAPAAVIATANSGVDAAYYSANPTTIGTFLDGSVDAISTSEYWDIKSMAANGKISLTWRVGSNVTSLTNSDLNNLVIAGWEGTKWVQIPSSYDVTSILSGTSTLTAGSITSDYDVVLSGFSAFTLAAKGDCSPVVPSSGITKTWNGNWTPSAPTIVDPVVINAPYSGNLSCNSLTLNADITVANNEFVDIQNGVTGTGKIIMSSQASVVQRSSGNAPNIELVKQTRDLHRYDYVYWGSPVAPAATNANTDFFAQLASARPTTIPTGTVGAFDLKYTWQAGSTWGWQTLGAMPLPGTGFIMRVKPIAPFTNTTNVDKINLKYAGIANNGDYTVNVTQNPTFPNGSSSHNLLANPYPSAIDGDMFLRLNTNIDGVIYVWQQATAPGTPLATTYSQADYLAYTRAGFVAPSSVTGAFDGKIASGQGFQVKALGTGPVTFTNCMRLTGNNNSFFRTSTQYVSVAQPLDRFKLTMTGANDVYSQILVAYTPNATLDYDRMYDAGRNSTSTAQLYSILEADGRKLAINARPEFVATDIVPLGVSKNNTNGEIFTVNIEQKEGVFNNGQNVYLYDKALEIYHDFNNGNYSFTTNTTALNDRFDIVYQTSTLNNPQFNGYNAIATISKEVLTIKATKEMETIDIFDITGKHIRSFDAKNNSDFTSPFVHAEGFYIAKIKLTTGEVVTQKLINSTK
ncbi:hypothetical protein [Flavobacterium sp.]|uniref:hypothetical protein n=1 Tax=Flavobacterium sp. TaxID=239 RepID=UPI0037C06596